VLSLDRLPLVIHNEIISYVSLFDYHRLATINHQWRKQLSSRRQQRSALAPTVYTLAHDHIEMGELMRDCILHDTLQWIHHLAPHEPYAFIAPMRELDDTLTTNKVMWNDWHRMAPSLRVLHIERIPSSLLPLLSLPSLPLLRSLSARAPSVMDDGGLLSV
jgi:hypothetical protein